VTLAAADMGIGDSTGTFCTRGLDANAPPKKGEFAFDARVKLQMLARVRTHDVWNWTGGTQIWGPGLIGGGMRE
jgi:hypothetical protein